MSWHPAGMLCCRVRIRIRAAEGPGRPVHVEGHAAARCQSALGERGGVSFFWPPNSDRPGTAQKEEEDEEEGTPPGSPKRAAGQDARAERVSEASEEIERLKAALEEAKEQQQWALSAVVRAKEAEKEDLAQALQCAPAPSPLLPQP